MAMVMMGGHQRHGCVGDLIFCVVIVCRKGLELERRLLDAHGSVVGSMVRCRGAHGELFHSQVEF